MIYRWYGKNSDGTKTLNRWFRNWLKRKSETNIILYYIEEADGFSNDHKVDEELL